VTEASKGPACPVCGEPTRRTGRQGRPPTYDKPECRKAAQAVQPKGRPPAAPVATKPSLASPHCGRPVAAQSARPIGKERTVSATKVDEAMQATRVLFFEGKVDQRAFVQALQAYERFGDDHVLSSASDLPALEELAGRA
jgi:hypothetical protein